MAYIVPKEMPKSCHDCPFHYCSEYHPFWSSYEEKRNTQTIRCQAITPFRSTILDIKDETFKADWCPLVDAADVAPKSEVIDKFAELLKERLFSIPTVYNSHFCRIIENTAKEMKGGE